MLALTATTLAFYVDPITLTAVPPACDRSDRKICDSFCAGKCGAYNTSLGEKGTPQNITVYRITPKNVTGVSNKNTADPAGDISFVITKKNVTQTCLHCTDCQGCHTDVEFLDLYLQAVIEFDGQWGPYQMCNPADGYDTTDWVCGQDCMNPSHHGCPPPRHGKKNGTECHYGGGDDCLTCWCERTAHTAGREAAPGQFESPMGDAGYVPQCASSFNPWDSGCGAPSPLFGGKVYLNLTGWSFESVSAMACKRCHADDHCSGWVSHDNITAQLFSGATKSVSAAGCVGGKRFHNPWEKFGGSWFGIANLGDGHSSNIWYSTPDEGECKNGAPLGTDGCTWRLIEEKKYANATCVDEKADAAVELHGKTCFDQCPHPLNRNTDCYLDCYRNTLMGDASQNITRVPPDAMITPWVAAFASDDPAAGGCPPVTPTVGPFGAPVSRPF